MEENVKRRKYKTMKKLAIIGASYLQDPLIQRAKQMGIETHVFAWAAGDVGEKSADFFYPISITEKEKILQECIRIGIDGICSISSDLAVVTVNYVSEKMGLVGNDSSCTVVSTNKHEMRRRFEEMGDPSPKSTLIENIEDLKLLSFEYPVIVKPTDRSGSRGITKVESPEKLGVAVAEAFEQGFEKKVLIEEYVDGEEYSVEYISWEGMHQFLALTKKYTTKPPRFIEIGHVQPAPVSAETLERVKAVVSHALDSLSIKYGASHSEVKILPDESIKIIEIGGRMGGDFIGSDLVKLSTGVDFIKAVIDVSLGIKPGVYSRKLEQIAGVRFVMNGNDEDIVNSVDELEGVTVIASELYGNSDAEVTDSSNRHGYFIFTAENYHSIEKIFE